MSIRIGHKASSESAISLLQGCHSNIRRFLATTRALASDKAATPEDVAGTALSVSRYFREGLPLHVADEEQSVAPRLRDVAPAGELIVRLLSDHASHPALLEHVVELCDELGQAPERRVNIAPRLGPAAADLSQSLESHLAWEEADLFPLLPRLTPDDHLAILGEMRRRRGHAPVWP